MGEKRRLREVKRQPVHTQPLLPSPGLPPPGPGVAPHFQAYREAKGRKLEGDSRAVFQEVLETKGMQEQN